MNESILYNAMQHYPVSTSVLDQTAAFFGPTHLRGAGPSGQTTQHQFSQHPGVGAFPHQGISHAYMTNVDGSVYVPIDTTIFRKTLQEEDTWLTAQFSPWVDKTMDDPTIEWDEYEVNNTPPGRAAPFTAGPLVTVKSRHRRRTMARFSQGVQNEIAFANTERGQLETALKMAQLLCSFIQLVNEHIYDETLSQPDNLLRAVADTLSTPEALSRQIASDYMAIQKNDHDVLQQLFTRISYYASTKGFTPNVVFIPKGSLHYCNDVRTETFERRSPEHGQFQVQRFGKQNAIVHEVTNTPWEGNKGPSNPYERISQIGEWYVNAHILGPEATPEQVSVHRNIDLFTMRRNGYETIPLTQALKFNGRYAMDGKKRYTTKALNTLYNLYAYRSKDSGFEHPTNEDDWLDMDFCVHGGKLKVVQKFGDYEEVVLSNEDVLLIAKSVINALRITPETRQLYDEEDGDATKKVDNRLKKIFVNSVERIDLSDIETSVYEPSEDRSWELAVNSENMQKRKTFAETLMSKLERDVFLKFIDAPIGLGTAMRLYNAQAIFPYTVCYSRPQITHRTAAVVATQLGTYETPIGPSLIGMAQNVYQQSTYYNMSARFAAICKNSRATFMVPDAMCMGYIRGRDIEFMPVDREDFNFNSTNADLLVILEPFSKKSYPVDVDLVGTWNPGFLSLVTGMSEATTRESKKPHYFNHRFTRELLNIQHQTIPPTTTDAVWFIKQTNSNTFCRKGFSRQPIKSAQEKAEVQGDSALGPFCYEGCAGVYQCLDKTFRQSAGPRPNLVTIVS